MNMNIKNLVVGFLCLKINVDGVKVTAGKGGATLTMTYTLEREREREELDFDFFNLILIF